MGILEREVQKMEQIGQVVKITEGKAVVLVRRNQACGTCTGCGLAAPGAGENYLEAINTVNAAVGDRVKVVPDTAHVLKASFVAYILPMLALLAGVYVGQTLDQALDLGVRLAIVLGLLFFLASFLGVRAYDRKVAAGQTMASIVAVVTDEQPVDEQC